MTGSPEKPEEPERLVVYRVRLGGRGKPRPLTPADMRENLEQSYVEMQAMDIRLQERRRLEDIRRRADGQPSAQPPQAVLPLRNWATVQADPVGDEYDYVADRLLVYERWLLSLKKHGLYDGPHRLTVVNRPPENDATGGATSGES